MGVSHMNKDTSKKIVLFLFKSGISIPTLAKMKFTGVKKEDTANFVDKTIYDNHMIESVS